MSLANIFLRSNLVLIPVHASGDVATQSDVATILMNVSHYGYALSLGAYQALIKLSHDELVAWWTETETHLKSITGADRKVADFVVYKNFPREVLEKSVAAYWIPQILMYWGFPKEMFTEVEQPREKMQEKCREKVLHLATENSANDILLSHLKNPSRWKEDELRDVLELLEDLVLPTDKIVFKENMVAVAVAMMERGKKMRMASATDVLRLGAGLSDGDISLREDVKFKSLGKPVRRWLLAMLETCANIKEDMARRPEVWKRFLKGLHAGDFRRQYPIVCAAMDDLYHDRLTSFNSEVELGLESLDENVLALLSTRPGDFRRRLVHTMDLFGDAAVRAFLQPKVLGKLTVMQMVSLRSHLDTVNLRRNRCFPPGGNWTKLQVAGVRYVDGDLAGEVSAALGKALTSRLPKIKYLDPATRSIKLPTNGSDTGPFTRGTEFPIPDEVEFIRSVSYWRVGKRQTVWFDNGWNFFDSSWKDLGACCWAYGHMNYGKGSAIFSGDPVSGNEMKGRAAQMIDLYPSKLVKLGVRYAVWNILAWSRIPFSDVEEVFAALQWGKDPQKGSLFEPSRAQLAFPLTGKNLTKYVCVVDLVGRKLIYLDANLRGNVRSAGANGKILEEQMPAFMEYVDSIPSVYDLLSGSVDEKNGKAYVLYSDKEVDLFQDEPAYVFRPENKSNSFTPLNLNALLT